MSRFNTFGRSTTHRERYFHIPVEGDVYSHITIFARETDVDNGVWQLGYSFCSINDVFCKKIGRSLARRRLMVARQQSTCPDTDTDIPTIHHVPVDNTYDTLYDSVVDHLVTEGYLDACDTDDTNTRITAPYDAIRTVSGFMRSILVK